MSMPLDVSVIISVYNTSKYLRRCLDSVFKAIPKRSEVIVINDGSTDDSEKIILEYQAFHKNLRYVKQANQGLASVKNHGLKLAKGDYIIFLDSDDFVEKDSYTEMFKVARAEKADLVECSIATIYPDGGVIVREIGSATENSSIVERSLNWGLMSSSCNKLVKRELYSGVEFPLLHNEDVAVTPALILKAQKIVSLSQPYYHYVQYADSINHVFSDTRFDIFKTTKICLERAEYKSAKEKYMLEGYLFAHQLVALLFCAIAEIKSTPARKKALAKFCQKYHELNLQKDNLYAKKYLATHGILELYGYIESSDLAKIDQLITTIKV